MRPAGQDRELHRHRAPGLRRGDFHCLLDGELFLPESWAADRDRCREAGIPDDMVYRPKWQIALELVDRAVANGIRFEWLTFDEGYGGKPEFLRESDRPRPATTSARCRGASWAGSTRRGS